MRPRDLRRFAFVLAALATAHCSDPVEAPVDGGRDVASVVDRGATVDVFTPRDVPLSDAVLDLGALDAGSLVDAARDGGGSALDAGAGLGAIEGSCGTLAAMLRSPSPSLVRNGMVFMTGDRYARASLSPEGQRIFDTPNAGGSSAESEIMTFELLRRCEGASLVATETEVMYRPPDDSGANSITDILVSIGGERVGVSVTRAYRPMPMVVTDAVARDIIATKLQGINRSSQRVLPAHRWVKQILSVWAANAEAAEAVVRVWPTLDASLRADTILLLTVSRGGGFIYCNPDPPLGAECPSL